jgi:hypothetical protein
LASDKQYRTVIGIVQFDVKEGEAAGKAVRNLVLRQTGFKEQAVSAYVTVWPSHAELEIARGDVLIVEGTYNRGKGTTQSGEERTYHNISATRIAKLGTAIEGKRPEVENDTDEPVEDDDIPF